MKKAFLFTIISFVTICSYSQNYTDTLNAKLNGFHSENALPGFSAAIVNMDGVIYNYSLGYADLENKTPFNEKTVQCIASTTKTTISFAIMKLIEEGKLSLESPINDFLPFQVIHPLYQDSIIRIKHLVTHTSGIIDTENNYDLRCFYFTKQTSLALGQLEQEDLDWLNLIKKNKKISLKKYHKNVFSAKGKWKSDDTFSESTFGQQYEYSNLGAGLMAYIVERLLGKRFDKYIDEHVFKTLGMNETTFNENKINPVLQVKNYLTEEKISYPFLGLNNYPDGGIYSNAEDLSKYLIEMIKGYNGKSNLLTKSSFLQMMTPLLPDEIANTNSEQKTFNNIGVFWQFDDDGTIKHYGGNPLGGAIYCSFNPETNIGKILMTNCEATASRATIVEFISIWRTMAKYETLIN